MTQPISVNDVLEVTLEGTNEQQPFAHVRHYIVTAVGTAEGVLGAIQDHYTSVLVPAWEAVATSLWVAECLSISRVAPQPMNVDFSTFTPAVVGDVATDGLPPMDAVLFRLLTDEVGPRNRGRSYICGIPEASTNGGVLLATAFTDLLPLGAALTQIINSSGNTLAPVIFSRTNYIIPAENPEDPPTHPENVTDYTSLITSYAIQGNIATQRRRRTKRSSFSS